MGISAFGATKFKPAKIRRTPKPKVPSGWFGFDLDGVLAEYSSWKAITHIGEPIEPIITIVKDYLKKGYDVRIFTARIDGLSSETLAQFTKAMNFWSVRHLGQQLPITNIKDQKMIELWDDRAVAVDKNTGKTARWVNGELVVTGDVDGNRTTR